MTRPAAALLVVLGLVVGFVAGQWLGTTTPEATPVVPAQRSKPGIAEHEIPPRVNHDVREALLIKDPLDRTARLVDVLRDLGPEDIRSVREAYDTVLLDVGDNELILLGMWWGELDPNAALQWTLLNWTTRHAVPVQEAIMRAWGRRDPVAAMAATTSAQSDATKRRWTTAVLQGWDESMHDGALEFAESLAPGVEQQFALATVARRRVIRDGPEAVIEWAEALPDDKPELKRQAIRRVATAVAHADPEMATAFAERHLDGPYGERLAYRVAMAWVAYDPEATMMWLSGLPDGKNRKQAVGDTYYQWRLKHRAPAVEWIRKVKWEPWLDPALAVHARGLGRRDPPAGMKVAEQITDEEERRYTMGIVARIWLKRDREAANAWLAESELSPEYIARIRAFEAKATPAGARDASPSS